MTAVAVAFFLLGAVAGFAIRPSRPARVFTLRTEGDLEAVLDHVIRQGATLPEPQRSRFFAEIQKDPPAPQGVGLIVTRDAEGFGEVLTRDDGGAS